MCYGHVVRDCPAFFAVNERSKDENAAVYVRDHMTMYEGAKVELVNEKSKRYQHCCCNFRDPIDDWIEVQNKTCSRSNKKAKN